MTRLFQIIRFITFIFLPQVPIINVYIISAKVLDLFIDIKNPKSARQSPEKYVNTTFNDMEFR